MAQKFNTIVKEGILMTNINCSANCVHEKNGKCTLNHVSITQSVMGHGTDCAYFSPREKSSDAPPEKE